MYGSETIEFAEDALMHIQKTPDAGLWVWYGEDAERPSAWLDRYYEDDGDPPYPRLALTVVEHMRGPAGPVGPTGAMGLSGGR